MIQYKVDGNKVLWNNGEKWLIKETCNSDEEALTLLASLQENA